MKEFYRHPSGSSSAVERQLPKLDVAGSIPVSRSIQSQLTDEEPEAFFAKSARVARNCRIRARSDSETLSNFRPIPNPGVLYATSQSSQALLSSIQIPTLTLVPTRNGNAIST